MKTAIATLALIVIGSLISDVKSTEVKSCTDVDAPVPSSVEIENCAEPPCTVFIGSTSVTKIKFTAPRKLEHIAPKAVATVLGLVVDYPLEQVDACDTITNTQCPLEEGQEVEYTFNMEILAAFPAVSLNLEFSLIDKDNGDEPFECYTVDIDVKSEK